MHLCAKELKLLDTKSTWLVLPQVGVLRHSKLFGIIELRHASHEDALGILLDRSSDLEDTLGLALKDYFSMVRRPTKCFHMCVDIAFV